MLAPKVSVVVDGGGRLHLDALTADIRLRAVNTATESMLHVALAGDAASATPLGLATPDAAVEIVSDLLAAIAALGPDARAADLLRARGLAIFVRCHGTRIEAASHLPSRPRAEPIALHRLKDGACALGLGLAFGHAQADALIELTGIAKHEWRAAGSGRRLTARSCSGHSPRQRPWRREGPPSELGFIIEARDPRRRIVACPGAPSCASGLIAARAIAAQLADHSARYARDRACLGLRQRLRASRPCPSYHRRHERKVAASSATARLATRRRPTSLRMTLPPLLNRLTKTREAVDA